MAATQTPREGLSICRKRQNDVSRHQNRTGSDCRLMSFRKGVTFRPAKARVAAIFGARPLNSAVAASAVKLSSSVDKLSDCGIPEEGVSQESALFWFERHALPLGSTIRSVPTGIPVRGKSESERRRLYLVNAALERQGMRKGTPDTVTTHLGRALWIELKREGSTYSALETHQRIEILRLLDSGCRVGIARNKEEMQILYQTWGVPLRQTLPVDTSRLVTATGQRWPLEGEDLRSMILQTTNPLALRRAGYEPEARPARAVKGKPLKENGSRSTPQIDRGRAGSEPARPPENPNPSIHE